MLELDRSASRILGRSSTVTGSTWSMEIWYMADMTSPRAPGARNPREATNTLVHVGDR